MTTVYLVPSFLAEEAIETIPAYVLETIKKCNVIFAENERTARRFLKSLDKSVIIDDYEWHTIHKAEAEQVDNFKAAVRSGKQIAIISEAGCPGVADPGQVLIAVAQEMNCTVKPLVGPSSILLALMASGMNGQHFEFVGYLPIDNGERIKSIRELEAASQRKQSTIIFIETPYRNDPLLETLVKTCRPSTRLCIASQLTAADEYVKTKTVEAWKKEKPVFHKKLLVFLLQA
jgi:16S rRNA (cytidine1402-2'-O)-methyltransferase